MRSEHSQLSDRLRLESQLPQVASHPRLIGDDRGVLGVGLAFAAVGPGDPIDRDTGQVEQPLTILDQQCNDERRRPVSQIDCPRHVVGTVQRGSDDLTEIWFSIDDPARQQTSAFPVDDHHMVMALARIDAGPRLPDSLHPALLRSVTRCPVDARRPFPTQRSMSQISISGQHVAKRRAANQAKPSPRQKTESHTQRSWVPEP